MYSRSLTNAVTFFGPFAAVALVFWSSFCHPNRLLAKEPPSTRVPNLKDVKYGKHERQKLDVYIASNDGSSPVVIYIHGGGWVRGDKTPVPFLDQLLDAGISVVAVNYRFTWQAQKENVEPPVSWPLEDAVRAVQFVRFKAAEFKIDKSRIGLTGGSAGGCSSLYVALHDEMANPNSDDPVERESTRVSCVAGNGPQTSLDPMQVKEWIPNSVYGGHAFGFMDPDDLATRDTRFVEFLENRNKLLPSIRAYSPLEHVSKNDPPIYLNFGKAPTTNPNAGDPTHSANFGVPFREKCLENGVLCELAYPGSTTHTHKDIPDFLVKNLKRSPDGN